MTPSNFYSIENENRPITVTDADAPMSETSAVSLSENKIKANLEQGEGNNNNNRDDNIYALTGIDDRAPSSTETPAENRLSVSKIRGHENIGRRLNGTAQMVQNVLKTVKNSVKLQ